MTWNSVMGIISSAALLCPVAAILALRLYSYRSFPVLLFYYTSGFIYNLLTEGYLPASPEFVRYWGLTNNLLDTPVMLLFLTYFSTSFSFTRRMHGLIAAFILFEIIVVAVTGISTKAITIILGPGVLLILSLGVLFFIRQVKIAILNRKATGKAIMAAAILFAYGCFGLIYLMYYVFETPYVEDTFLVYFLVTTLSSLLLSTGIVIEEKRIRKLHELKLTRRELSDLYAGEKKAVPIQRTALLDFDREQWS